MQTAPPTGRTLHPIVWLCVVVAIVALMLAANAWSSNADDVNTDHLVTQLCADTPDC